MRMMEHRVREYIEKHGLICPGDTVVAGVSGGADSLCLFLILHRLSGEMGFGLHVVHVHHGLRLSAQEDLDFVEELCGQMQVPCTLVRVDAAESARQWGTGVEEAGRMLRYDAFRRVCSRLAQGDCPDGSRQKVLFSQDTLPGGQSEEHQKRGAFRIAVAHHREDQAETVLFHLCRGTDLRGARGMLPVNGQIIRPLLDESRSAIEQYLTERGIVWREDETNSDTAYTRNYLRREIIPRLEDGVHAAAAERIAQFASVCAQAEEYLEKETDRAMARCLSECMPVDRILLPEGMECQSVLRLDALAQEDPYLQGRILYRCLAGSTAGGRDVGAVHVDALRSLCGKKTDGRVSMPSGVTVFKISGKFYFCRRAAKALQGKKPAPDRKGAAKGFLREDLPLNGSPSGNNSAGKIRPSEEERYYPLSEEEYECSVQEFDGRTAAIPRNEYTKWFDYDKIGTFPVFRTREPGDCMILFAEQKAQTGSGGTDPDRTHSGSLSGGDRDRNMINKKLARIMLDGKIPAGVRDKIVLPFNGKEALWVPGLRMGDSCRVTHETTRILEIQWHMKRESND